MGLVAGHQFILLELQVISPLFMERRKGGGRLNPKKRLGGLCKHAMGINCAQEQDH